MSPVRCPVPLSPNRKQSCFSKVQWPSVEGPTSENSVSLCFDPTAVPASGSVWHPCWALCVSLLGWVLSTEGKDVSLCLLQSLLALWARLEWLHGAATCETRCPTRAFQALPVCWEETVRGTTCLSSWKRHLYIHSPSLSPQKLH